MPICSLQPPWRGLWSLPWTLSRRGCPCWTGWGRDRGQGAGDRAPTNLYCLVCLAGNRVPSVPRGWWPNHLTSRTLENHLTLGLLVLGCPSSSRLPDSGASLAPQQGAVAQVGRGLEGRGEDLGGRSTQTKPLSDSSGTFHYNSQPRKLIFPKDLLARGTRIGQQNCCCLVDTSCNYNLTSSSAHLHLQFARPGGLLMTSCPQERSWAGGAEIYSKQSWHLRANSDR